MSVIILILSSLRRAGLYHHSEERDYIDLIITLRSVIIIDLITLKSEIILILSSHQSQIILILLSLQRVRFCLIEREDIHVHCTHTGLYANMTIHKAPYKHIIHVHTHAHTNTLATHIIIQTQYMYINTLINVI